LDDLLTVVSGMVILHLKDYQRVSTNNYNQKEESKYKLEIQKKTFLVSSGQPARPG